MSDRSAIEWTDATWNPVRGCEKVSPGCKHCYAETFAERFRGVPNHPYEQGFEPMLVPHKLPEPLTWGGPRLVFVNSMSDLFQRSVPDAYVSQVAEIMLLARWHTYQVLTKRADRMREMLKTTLRPAADVSHIWWGVNEERGRCGYCCQSISEGSRLSFCDSMADLRTRGSGWPSDVSHDSRDGSSGSPRADVACLQHRA